MKSGNIVSLRVYFHNQKTCSLVKTETLNDDTVFDILPSHPLHAGILTPLQLLAGMENGWLDAVQYKQECNV